MQLELPHFDVVIGINDIEDKYIFKILNYNFKNAIFLFKKDIVMRLISKPGNDLYCKY